MARNDRTSRNSPILVLGLGRFGGSLALDLAQRGCDVLGLDKDPAAVQRVADELGHAAVADTTDIEVLKQLGVGDFRRAVVGIGTHLEASILTTAALADLEVPHIWAKAVNRQHGKILERIGAHHVVLPEQDMGVRVAHLVTGRMLDYIQFEDDFAMVKTIAPADLVDRPLGETRLRSRFGITVVGIKRPGEEFTYATQYTELHQGDVIIVSGSIAQVEAFANRT